MNDPIEDKRLTLAVGIDEAFSAFSVGRILHAFTGEHPAARLRVERGSASDVNAGVRNGHLSVGLGLLNEIEAGIEARTLYFTSLVAVVSGLHRFASKAELNLEEVTNENLVLLTSRHLQRITVDQEINRRGLTLRNTLEISAVDEVLSCVREGLGVSILFGEAIHDDQLLKIPIADFSGRHEIGYYFRPGERDPLADSFVNTIETTFR